MEAERILNEYEAWRRQRLEAPVDVSVGAYLSHLRTEAIGDLCAELYAELNGAIADHKGDYGTLHLDGATGDRWLETLKDAGFGTP